MSAQDLTRGAAEPGMYESPATPLHAYSPGNLARLNPHERGRVLKRKKRVLPRAPLVTPITSGGGGSGGSY